MAQRGFAAAFRAIFGARNPRMQQPQPLPPDTISVSSHDTPDEQSSLQQPTMPKSDPTPTPPNAQVPQPQISVPNSTRAPTRVHEKVTKTPAMLRRLGLDPSFPVLQAPTDDASSHYSLRPRRRRRSDAPEPRGAETSKPPPESRNNSPPIPMQQHKSISLRPSQASRTHNAQNDASSAARDTPALRLPAPSAATTSAIAARPGLVSVSNLGEASTATLHALCRKVGLPTTGTKEDMRELLLAKVSQRRFLNEDTLVVDSDGNPRALSTMPVTPPNATRPTTASMVLDAQSSPATTKKNVDHVTTTTTENRTPRRGYRAPSRSTGPAGDAVCATKAIPGGVTAKGGPGAIVAKSGSVDMKNVSRCQPRTSTRPSQDLSLRLDIPSRGAQVDVAGSVGVLPALSSTGIGAPHDLPLSPVFGASVTGSPCILEQGFQGGSKTMQPRMGPRESVDARGGENIGMKGLDGGKVAPETVFRELSKGNRRLSQGEYEACLRALNENFHASAENRNVNVAALLSGKGVLGAAATIPRSSWAPGPSHIEFGSQLHGVRSPPVPPNTPGHMSSSGFPNISGAEADLKAHPVPSAATVKRAADLLRTSQQQPLDNSSKGSLRNSGVNLGGTGGVMHDIGSERYLPRAELAATRGFEDSRAKEKERTSQDPFQHSFSGAVGGPGVRNSIGRAIWNVDGTGKQTDRTVGRETLSDNEAFCTNRPTGGRTELQDADMPPNPQFATPRDVVRSFNRYGGGGADDVVSAEGPDRDSLSEFQSQEDRDRNDRSRETTLLAKDDSLPSHLRGFTSARKLGLSSSKRRSMNQSAVQSGRIMRLPNVGSRRPASTNSGDFLRNLPRSSVMNQRNNFLALRAHRRSIRFERSPNPPLSAKSLRILEEIKKVRNENRTHSTTKRTRSPLPVPPSALKRARINGHFTKPSENYPTEPVHMEAPDANQPMKNTRASDGPFQIQGDAGGLASKSRLSWGLRVTPATSKKRRSVVYGSGKKRSRPSSLSAAALAELKSAAKGGIENPHNFATAQKKNSFAVPYSNEKGKKKVTRTTRAAEVPSRNAGNRLSLPAFAIPERSSTAQKSKNFDQTSKHDNVMDNPEAAGDSFKSGQTDASAFQLQNHSDVLQTKQPISPKSGDADERKFIGILDQPPKPSSATHSFGGSTPFTFGGIKSSTDSQPEENAHASVPLSSAVLPSTSTSQGAFSKSADNAKSFGIFPEKEPLNRKSQSLDTISKTPEEHGDDNSSRQTGSILDAEKARAISFQYAGEEEQKTAAGTTEASTSKECQLFGNTVPADAASRQLPVSAPTFTFGKNGSEEKIAFTMKEGHAGEAEAFTTSEGLDVTKSIAQPTKNIAGTSQTRPAFAEQAPEKQDIFSPAANITGEPQKSTNTDLRDSVAEEMTLNSTSQSIPEHPPLEARGPEVRKQPPSCGVAFKSKSDSLAHETTAKFQAPPLLSAEVEVQKETEGAAPSLQAPPPQVAESAFRVAPLDGRPHEPNVVHGAPTNTPFSAFGGDLTTGGPTGSAPGFSNSGVVADSSTGKSQISAGANLSGTGGALKLPAAPSTGPFSLFGSKPTTEDPAPVEHEKSEAPKSQTTKAGSLGLNAGAVSGSGLAGTQTSGFNSLTKVKKDPSGPFGAAHFNSIPPTSDTAKFVFEAPSQSEERTDKSGFGAVASSSTVSQPQLFGSTVPSANKTATPFSAPQASADLSTPALGSGIFGTSSSSAFGLSSASTALATNSPVFRIGGKLDGRSDGSKGTANTVAFGDVSAGVFGGSAAAFGATRSGLFGGSSAAGIGASSGGSFGASSGGAFGASGSGTLRASSLGVFGTSGAAFGSSTNSTFGSASSIAFGSTGAGTFPAGSKGPFNVGVQGSFNAASSGILQGNSMAAFGGSSGGGGPFSATTGTGFGSGGQGTFGSTDAQNSAVQFGLQAPTPGVAPSFGVQGGLPTNQPQPNFAAAATPAPAFGFGAPAAGEGTPGGFGASFGQPNLSAPPSTAPSGGSGLPVSTFSFGANGSNAAPLGGAFNIGAAPSGGQQPARRGRRTVRGRRLLR